MAQYERTVRVSTDADKTFRFLSDPQNLPRYVATMVMARPEQGERLRVAANVEGRHEEGDARFQTDDAQRLIQWGSEDAGDYGGRLQVASEGDGSVVRLQLRVPDAHDEAQINGVLDETMGNIERLLGQA